MPKLTFLKQKWTIEQQELFDTAITELEKLDIHDDVSFLMANLMEVSKTTSIALPVLDALRQHLASLSHCQVDSTVTEARYIRTSFPHLNDCLSGGLRMGDLIEITSTDTLLMEKFFMKVIGCFLAQHSLGKVIHIDTAGRFQSRLLNYPQMPLSRIECNKAFTITTIDQLIERHGALYLASKRHQHHRNRQPLLIVIEDMGSILDSNWNTTTDQVLKLHQTILLLKSMDICIMASYHVVPNIPRRHVISWNNMIDQRMILSSTNGKQVLANISKARHVKTPQVCHISI
ncbi:unnamed protein product [Absidia cylindrospora]